ncbi:uncharacterized protein M6B38_364460 [Iris pallida]|uniref:DUF7356 domain-containing protein n=1 Tax=Iris pallida TaxID=29817 RepID=A0AAX6GI32_IRIPA|nr:uncharacterized protein M6B38_364460 [Iris pallida]
MEMTRLLLPVLLLVFAILRSSNASGSPSPSPAYLPIPKGSGRPKPEPKNEGRKNGNSALAGGPSGSGKAAAEAENCDASSLETCHGGQDFVACLRHPKTDPKGLVLLVQNKRENNLSVFVEVSASFKVDSRSVNLTKHGAEKMIVPGDATNNLKIVLNSGKEHCVLEVTSSVPGWNPLQQYTAQLTPTNGAYFVFASLTVAAGVWACCKFARKGRRVDAGVPYQQLEMGAQTQQSSSAVVEASMADGWDQGWDDDWDEEEGTMRPSNTSHSNGNVSSNGLTSRPANKKNDWDVDWDD